ncbi:antibiotic biosynthesis monooxygenase [Streptosporangium fragile]|uniref:Antibiotic biosynthesis monooxygenase n=1 Tax=Streptosporangium fragile TaxID=46186 RepID=A0ABP6IUD6_9ACTN
MIMRMWRGWTRIENADAYEKYLLATGYAGYTATEGNRGVCFTRRDEAGRSEFLLTSLWESWEAVTAFAGEDPSRAVFYDEDDRFLVERDLTAAHYEVFAAS